MSTAGVTRASTISMDSLVWVIFAAVTIWGSCYYYFGARLLGITVILGSLIFTPIILIGKKLSFPVFAKQLLVFSCCFYLCIATVTLPLTTYIEIFYFPILFGAVFIFKSQQKFQTAIPMSFVFIFWGLSAIGPIPGFSTYWVPAQFPYTPFRIANATTAVFVQILMNAVFDSLYNRATAQLTSIQSSFDKYRIVSRTTPNGVIVYINDNFCKVSKYRPAELIGKNHRILNSGLHSKEFFKKMWVTISAGKPWSGHIRNRAKDGRYYWVDSIITPVVDEDGVIKEYFTFTNDITVEKNKALLSDLISDIRGMFIVLAENKDGFYQHVLKQVLVFTESEYGVFCEMPKNENDTAFKPLLKPIGLNNLVWNYKAVLNNRNLSSSDFQNDFQDDLQVRIQDEVKSLNSLIASVIMSGMPQIVNLPLSPQIGLPIYYSDQLLGVICLAKRNIGYDSQFADDLSPILVVVGEILRSIALEAEVEQQSKVLLHNTQLASIGQIAAGVGHEINNPISIVRGLLGIINKRLKTKGNIDSEISDKIAQMNLAVERIRNIVNGLRVFARADELQFDSFVIEDLITETYLLMKDIFQQDGIVLELDLGENFVEIHGNRGRIQQVLVNLISNAKDATEGKTERRISIALKKSASNVKILVKDNGHGIPDELKQKIFEPFFTTKKVNTGIGIGLVLVNTIMKEHEGKIQVDSEVAVGTQITITLPTARLIQERAPKELSTAQPHEHLNTLTNKPSNVFPPSAAAKEPKREVHVRVLIVDDEEDLREIFQEILKGFGISVTEAKNGKEALELASKEHFDLIASDVNMPIMNGIKLLDNLRANTNIHQPKFVFVTGGMDMKQAQFDALKARTNGIFSKPYESKIIFSKICELFPDKVITKI